MAILPGSVLYACTMNTVRSPMAEGIMKHLFGNRVYVDSVGVRKGERNAFAVAVMDEIGIDLSRHRPKTFDELEDSYFDVVVSLSPEAQHRAVEMTRAMSCELVFWNTFDPTHVQGNRDTVLEAYRAVRDTLFERISDYFSAPAGPTV